jgi:RNA polymerase sigma factor (TIGR02999 family)
LPESPINVTQVLDRWNGGDADAVAELIPLVYEELRRLAAGNLAGERPGHTLQPTALVHEAYLRIVQQHSVSFENRLKFFAFAAQIMRRVLCDRARRRNAGKRGGGMVQAAVDVEIPFLPNLAVVDLERLDGALEALAEFDARKVRIVELRFFAGLSIADAAAAMQVSPATLKREWTVARAWLAHRLREEG